VPGLSSDIEFLLPLADVKVRLPIA
jgi:hypothetical protein